jgi:hypothetical protein
MGRTPQCLDCHGYVGWQHLAGCRLAPGEPPWQQRLVGHACQVCGAAGAQFAHLIGQGSEAPTLVPACLARDDAYTAQRLTYDGVWLCRRDHMILDIWTGMLPGYPLYSRSQARLAQYRQAFEQIRAARETLLKHAAR